MPRRSTSRTISMRAVSSPSRGSTQRMPASARSSAARISAGACVSGLSATRSMSTGSHAAPATVSVSARLAATSALASSATRATRSPAAIASRHGALDRAIPAALVGLPSERDAGAAVLVIRLDDEAVAMSPQVRQQIDGPAAARHAAVADQRRPRHVAPDHVALAVGEEMRSAIVGEHGEERFLVRDLAAQRVGDADRAPLVRVDECAALAGARDDVVDQHAAIDEVDAPAGGEEPG